MTTPPLPRESPDPLRSAFLALVDSQLRVDWSFLFLGYHVTRSLREIGDRVRDRGWPRTPEDRLNLTLIPYLDHAAREAGVDWTAPGPLSGRIAPLFEIDARTMNDGRGREQLSPAEFADYVRESRALFEEFRAIRARMHNGEE